MLILKNKDLLLIEATNSCRRVNLLLSHLLFAICVINSTEVYTPSASYKQMVFLSLKHLINGDHNQQPHPPTKKTKTLTITQPRAEYLVSVHSFTHSKDGTANPTLPSFCYHESNILSLWNTGRDKGRLFSWTG